MEVDSISKDRYGRTIAWVYVNGVSLDRDLLRAGLALHFKRYSKDKDLAELEDEARVKKIGLWSDPNPIPPWEWRRAKGNCLSVFFRMDTKEGNFGFIFSLSQRGKRPQDHSLKR